MLNIGQNLQEKRREIGITQFELAQRAGIPQAALSNIEKGKRDLTMSTFLRICRALGVSPSVVLEGASTVMSPKRPIQLTRTALERMAKVVLYERKPLSSAEREVADLLRKILPGVHKGRLSARSAREAWYRLRELFREGEIKTLAERVRDEQMRRKAA